jgi:hypothetical protein
MLSGAHCKGELSEYDMNGNYGWHRPKDCDFELEKQRVEAESVNQPILPAGDFKRTAITVWTIVLRFHRLPRNGENGIEKLMIGLGFLDVTPKNLVLGSIPTHGC